ncbi:MAG TPA: hypothetical protein VK154_11195, partial [Chitinophagales bacterium]|nr:hypothetical protein [Chitinophagales bacterium]
MVGGNKIDKVKAIGRLYDFSSRMKFHLIKKDFLEDEIGVLARKINDDIAIQSGINLFAAKEEKDLLEFEKYLNNYNVEYTAKHFNYIDIGDDIEFLKRIHSIS